VKVGGLPTSAARLATRPASEILDGDQLHVRHADEVAEIRGVVERTPVAYLDGIDANNHGRPLRGYAFSAAARTAQELGDNNPAGRLSRKRSKGEQG